MNIAIVANTSWNIHNFRTGLIKHLQAQGHTVYFVSPYDEFAILVSQHTKAKHLEIHKLERKGKNPLKDRALQQELYSIYTRHKIDIALHYTIKPNIYGALAAKKAGIKCICNVTGLGYVFLKKSIVNNLIRRVFKYALNKADMIVLQNDLDKQLMLHENIFPEKKIKMIYGSGINAEQFKPSLNAGQGEQVAFLFIGRLLYDKGIVELFEAYEKLHKEVGNVQLHIVGEIDADNPSAVHHHELEEIIANNQSVVYFGKRTDVRHNIAAVDCVVLPSYREGLPKSLLEAMAMGKPIITTDAPGCSQLINNNTNGFLCEAKNAEDLYQKMKAMYLLSTEQRATMGEACRKLVLEKYDEKIIVKQYESLIAGLFS